jgi:hypothetical protein
MNPFFNRQRITDPAYFQGRAREIEQLCSAIATRQCRALVGERKLGKSSLLSHIACPEVLSAYGLEPARHVFVYLDLEALASAERDDFWIEVLDTLQSALSDGDLRAATQVLLSGGDVRFMAVRRLLRRVRSAGFTVVLCLDEFEGLARNARFEPDFYGELRSLASELGVVMITASKRSLYELTYEHAETLSSPFFNIFSELPLTLMPPGEARLLLTRLAGQGGGPGFCDDEVDYALTLAGPHPFFLQLAGAQLYELPDHGEPHSSETYTAVRKRFLAEAEDHYRYIWNNLAPAEQTALLRIPQLGADTERSLRAKALVLDAGEHVVPFSDGFAAFLMRYQQSADDGTTRAAGSNDLTGQTLGQYRVLNLIGRGGMAEVYKGYQPLLDRYVAIKIMLPHHAADAEFVERFQREATAIARLRHANIVQIYDFGVQNNLLYMVMEFISGMTLKERLHELRQQKTTMPRREVLGILEELAAALDYAHGHGLVHRDVKPANVLLREEPGHANPGPTTAFRTAFNSARPLPAYTAILTDFGVAKLLEGVQATASGVSMGTPDYMSPEQGRGDEITTESDVYALGVLLFEMLTNRLPFAAETPLAVLLKHISDAPPALREILPDAPVELESVLARALAKSPHDRIHSAGELVSAVEEAWPDRDGAL